MTADEHEDDVDGDPREERLPLPEGEPVFLLVARRFEVVDVVVQTTGRKLNCIVLGPILQNFFGATMHHYDILPVQSV